MGGTFVQPSRCNEKFTMEIRRNRLTARFLRCPIGDIFSAPDWDMTLLFRTCVGFLIAFAVVQPHALVAVFETPAVASLKAELAGAARNEAARSPLDAAIFRAAGVLHATARMRDSRI
jgi:hypothetical protein